MVVRQDEPGEEQVARGADQDAADLAAVGGEGRMEEAALGRHEDSDQFSSTARYQARRKAITPGRAGRQPASEGWRRKRARLPVTAFTGAVQARRRRLAQVGPVAKASGWRARKRWKWAPYQVAWSRRAWRLSRTAACSTTAAGTKAVARPSRRARSTQSWSSEVVNASSKGPTRSQASRRTPRFRLPSGRRVSASAGRSGSSSWKEARLSASAQRLPRWGKVTAPPATGARSREAARASIQPGAGRQSASTKRKRSERASATARLRAAAGFRRSALSTKRTGPPRGTRPGASRPTTTTSTRSPGAPCPARPASVRSIQGESRSGMRTLRSGNRLLPGLAVALYDRVRRCRIK